MNRVERFKEIRVKRRKMLFSLILFFVLVIPGVCISDYSINSLMKNENRLGLLRVEQEDKSRYLLNILNVEMYVDTEYIEKDYQRVINMFNGILGAK